MSDPVISVIMATYNGAALLPETLRSLAAQTFADFELVVVDDCSTDGTRELLRGWPDARIRLIELDANAGPVRARNRAVAEARGRYIAGLDQDDLAHPERFARQVTWLDRTPSAVLLGTAARLIGGERGRRKAQATLTTPALIGWLLWIENPLVWSSVMLRADAARRLDEFTRPTFRYAEDIDLYHRIARYGMIARLDEELASYRLHASNASILYPETMDDSVTRAMTACHALRLGTAADDAAALLVRHVMRGLPVPDRATLIRLAAVLARLQHAYVADHRPDAESVRLIRWETAQRWAKIVRTGLRAGSLGIGDVAAARQEHLGLGYHGPDTLGWNAMIGGVRRSRQTLAAKIRRPGPSRANT